MINRLYGFAGSDLETARHTVEAALNVKLVAHESLYLGGAYYRLDGPDGTTLILRRNLDLLYHTGQDPVPERYAEPQYSQLGVLLYVSSNRPLELDDALAAASAGLTPLR